MNQELAGLAAITTMTRNAALRFTPIAQARRGWGSHAPRGQLCQERGRSLIPAATNHAAHVMHGLDTPFRVGVKGHHDQPVAAGTGCDPDIKPLNAHRSS